MEFFVELADEWKSLSILAKPAILDVLHGGEYASDLSLVLFFSYTQSMTFKDSLHKPGNQKRY